MNLHARAVELVLESNFGTHHRKRLGNVCRRLCEHRAQWLDRALATGGRHAGFGRRPAPAHDSHDAAEIALEHIDAPDFGHRPVRHFRNGFEHYSLADAVAHLAHEDLGDKLRLEIRGARKERMQRLELARARAASFNLCDFAKHAIHFRDRQRRLGLGRTQPQDHLDRLAKILGGGKDVFALIFGAGDRGGDFPDRAAAYLQALFITLRDRAPDHEARRDFRFANFERGEKTPDRLRHLEAALGLAEFLADDREIEKRRHLAN